MVQNEVNSLLFLVKSNKLPKVSEIICFRGAIIRFGKATPLGQTPNSVSVSNERRWAGFPFLFIYLFLKLLWLLFFKRM